MLTRNLRVVLAGLALATALAIPSVGADPTPASDGAGDPLLLVAGLGMVFAAGVILAVRNRQRTGTPPTGPGA